MPPVQKLTIPDHVIGESQAAVTAFLVANGWPDPSDDNSTHHVACAASHLGRLYKNDGALVSVYIEWTPAHYLIKVDLV